MQIFANHYKSIYYTKIGIELRTEFKIDGRTPDEHRDAYKDGTNVGTGQTCFPTNSTREHKTIADLRGINIKD